jgi:hypothetical protein
VGLRDRWRKINHTAAADRCGADTIDCSNIDERAVGSGLKKQLDQYLVVFSSAPQC